MFQTIAIEKLKPSDQNYRQHIDKKSLKELTASVKAKGVLQPILVRKLEGNGAYEIVAGHRRFAAATEAGLVELPVMVKELSDEEALEVQVIENSQREDPNPVDEAYGFKRLLDMGSHTPETLAAKLDRSVSYVLSRLKLLDIPEAAQKMIISGKIALGHALLLTRLKDPDEQKELLRMITEDNGITVAEAKSQIREFTLTLSTAVFDTAECGGCNYLSRNQCALFPELKKTDECMDRSCYAAKTREHFSDWLKEKEARGFKVICDYEEVESLTGYGAKGSKGIYGPGDEGSWPSVKPRRYKSQCMKCEKHAFYVCEVHHYHGTGWKYGEICLDLKCLNEMQGISSPASSTGGRTGVLNAEKAVACRNRFLVKHLPERVAASPVLQKRLLIYQLLDKFSHFEGREAIVPVSCYGDDVYRQVSKIPEEQLDGVLLNILTATIQETHKQVLLRMTPEAGIDMARDFEVDEEYLKTRTKAQLIELAGQLGFSLGVTEASKKGDIVAAFLRQELVGKVPAEIAKACEIDRYLDELEEENCGEIEEEME